MNEILASAKSVFALLNGKKYQIDYYQREYKWEQKQVLEMVDDLVSSFFQAYRPEHSLPQVESYGNYFLGSIIVSNRDGQSFVVDGQQRLTTLTLLLIYLRQLTHDLPGAPELASLIYSEKFGVKSFNLRVDEREPALLSLFAGETPTKGLESESVVNLVQRYQDVLERFPFTPDEEDGEESVDGEPLDSHEVFDERSLVFFVNWLIEKVFLVEITATSDNDAYTIFETMNDRGLSLTPTDMLKGHVLANITDSDERMKANSVWRTIVAEFNQEEREGSADFFKSWLRSQYGRSIRTGTGRVQDHDYDRIGSEFHRWVRDEDKLIGLKESRDYYEFIVDDMDFFACQYRRIKEASEKTLPDLDHIRYNAHRGFTLQPMLLLAPLRVKDSEDDIKLKLRLVAMYLDIHLTRKEWNYRRTAQSYMKVPIFNAMKQIRPRTDPEDLAKALVHLLGQDEETFDTNHRLGLHMQNGSAIHRMLARMTAYVENQSGKTLTFDTLVSDKIKNRYQVEHIWANRYDRHQDEFDHPADFRDYRNRIGDLVLLPSDINQSFRDRPYEQKLEHYSKQNMLLASLSPKAYKHEPGFLRFVQESGLLFHDHTEFKRADIDARQMLYLELGKRIWDPQHILAQVEAEAR
jgi:uncharacterized protein with ParB-like and HNH nuclease domain